MSFITDAIARYGRAVTSYEGLGAVRYDDTRKFRCEFAVCQLLNGRIILGCDFAPHSADVLFSQPSSFVGETSDGAHLHTERAFHDLPLLADPPTRPGCWAVYSLTDLVWTRGEEGTAWTHRYLLTNLLVDVDTSRDNPLSLNLPDVDGAIEVHVLPDYRRIEQTLHAFRDVVPTAHLILTHVGTASRRTAEDLCFIMSAARGTKIQWIYEEQLTPDDQLIRRLHVNRITKPFSSLPAIDSHRVRGLQRFVESVFPTYLKHRDRFALAKGGIDGFLDAKLEGDFLETRAAKVAIALEALIASIIKAAAPGKQYILPPKEYARMIPVIEAAIWDVLRNKNLKKDVAVAIANDQKLRGLNRRPFANLLRRVIRIFDVKISENDLQLFVACRNSLVHSGRFYIDTATDTERGATPPNATKFEEFIFMVDFVDRILLSILGYSGPYLSKKGLPIDWKVVEL